MKASAAFAIVISLCAIACGGPVDEGAPSTPVHIQQASLASNDPLTGLWRMTPYPWTWRIDADGSGYITVVDVNGPLCWHVGDLGLRNIVATSDPTVYTGEVATCDQGWVPMTIHRSTNSFTLIYLSSFVDMYRVP